MDAEEYISERAGIREYAGEQSRDEAEQGAYDDLLRQPSITRDQQIEGIARSVANDCRNNGERKMRMQRIEKNHGSEMATAIRRRAMQILNGEDKNG